MSYEYNNSNNSNKSKLGFYLENAMKIMIEPYSIFVDDKLICYFDIESKKWHKPINCGDIPDNGAIMYGHCNVLINDKLLFIFTQSEYHYVLSIDKSNKNAVKWQKSRFMNKHILHNPKFQDNRADGNKIYKPYFLLLLKAQYHIKCQRIILISIDCYGVLTVCVLNPDYATSSSIDDVFCESRVVISQTPWSDIFTPISVVLNNFSSRCNKYLGWNIHYFSLLFSTIKNDIFPKFQSVMLDCQTYFSKKNDGKKLKSFPLMTNENLKFLKNLISIVSQKDVAKQTLNSGITNSFENKSVKNNVLCRESNCRSMQFNNCFNCAILFNINWLNNYAINYNLSSIGCGNTIRMNEDYFVLNIPLFYKGNQCNTFFYYFCANFLFYPSIYRPHFSIYCKHNINAYNSVSSIRCLFINNGGKICCIYNDSKHKKKVSKVILGNCTNWLNQMRRGQSSIIFGNDIVAIDSNKFENNINPWFDCDRTLRIDCVECKWSSPHCYFDDTKHSNNNDNSKNSSSNSNHSKDNNDNRDSLINILKIVETTVSSIDRVKYCEPDSNANELFSLRLNMIMDNVLSVRKTQFDERKEPPPMRLTIQSIENLFKYDDENNIRYNLVNGDSLKKLETILNYNYDTKMLKLHNQMQDKLMRCNTSDNKQGFTQFGNWIHNENYKDFTLINIGGNEKKRTWNISINTIECDYCGNFDFINDSIYYKKCSLCNKRVYCSFSCQFAHWYESHKYECKEVDLKFGIIMNGVRISSFENDCFNCVSSNSRYYSWFNVNRHKQVQVLKNKNDQLYKFCNVDILNIMKWNGCCSPWQMSFPWNTRMDDLNPGFISWIETSGYCNSVKSGFKKTLSQIDEISIDYFTYNRTSQNENDRFPVSSSCKSSLQMRENLYNDLRERFKTKPQTLKFFEWKPLCCVEIDFGNFMICPSRFRIVSKTATLGINYSIWQIDGFSLIKNKYVEIDKLICYSQRAIRTYRIDGDINVKEYFQKFRIWEISLETKNRLYNQFKRMNEINGNKNDNDNDNKEYIKMNTMKFDLDSSMFEIYGYVIQKSRKARLKMMDTRTRNVTPNNVNNENYLIPGIHYYSPTPLVFCDEEKTIEEFCALIVYPLPKEDDIDQIYGAIRFGIFDHEKKMIDDETGDCTNSVSFSKSVHYSKDEESYHNEYSIIYNGGCGSKGSDDDDGYRTQDEFPHFHERGGCDLLTCLVNYKESCFQFIINHCLVYTQPFQPFAINNEKKIEYFGYICSEMVGAQCILVDCVFKNSKLFQLKKNNDVKFEQSLHHWKKNLVLSTTLSNHNDDDDDDGVDDGIDGKENSVDNQLDQQLEARKFEAKQKMLNDKIDDLINSINIQRQKRQNKRKGKHKRKNKRKGKFESKIQSIKSTNRHKKKIQKKKQEKHKRNNKRNEVNSDTSNERKESSYKQIKYNDDSDSNSDDEEDENDSSSSDLDSSSTSITSSNQSTSSQCDCSDCLRERQQA